ncbi:MAG: outer membrane protein assembly factor BamE [Alphaproteobacteria bacterium]|nr:MAG: outer membrane protein assembly factor BamE [Alphaproteobacteria bacterium]
MGAACAHFNGSWSPHPVRRNTPHRLSFLALIASLLAFAGLPACAPTVDKRGNLPEPDKLAEIRPGATTRDEVSKILGTPSSISVFNEKTWYYISRRTKQVAFFDPDVTDQQVYIVNFDDRGVVKAVDHRNLKDARDIEPAPGATPAPGRELTFLEQIIGNVGRFNKTSSSSSSGGDTSTQTGRPYEPGDPNKR